MTTATRSRPVRAARARELHEQGLNGLDIAERMGIARTTAYDLLADPDGTEARRRKAKNDGTCVDCGGRTKSGGEKIPPDRCANCAKEKQEADGWQPDEIVEAIRVWVSKHGRQPKSSEWMCAEDGRPITTTVVTKIGWAQALRRAGCKPRDFGPGAVKRPYGLTASHLAETVAAYEQHGLSGAADVLGITASSVSLRLKKAGYPRTKGRMRVPRLTPEQTISREVGRLEETQKRLRDEITEIDAQLEKWNKLTDTLQSMNGASAA